MTSSSESIGGVSRWEATDPSLLQLATAEIADNGRVFAIPTDNTSGTVAAAAGCLSCDCDKPKPAGCVSAGCLSCDCDCDQPKPGRLCLLARGAAASGTPPLSALLKKKDLGSWRTKKKRI